MEFKGTKGKWFVNWNGYYNEISSKNNSTVKNQVDGVDMGISTHLHMTINGKVESVNNSIEDRANAQLIAHAPEMLEMLIKYTNDISEVTPQQKQFGQMVRDLIKKATTI